MVDGNISTYFPSTDFSDAAGRGFTVDLKTNIFVIRVSLMSCRKSLDDTPPMNHFTIHVRNAANTYWQPCLPTGEKQAEYAKFTDFFCDHSATLGKGMLDNQPYRFGRHLRFQFNQGSLVTNLCFWAFRVMALVGV